MGGTLGDSRWRHTIGTCSLVGMLLFAVVLAGCTRTRIEEAVETAPVDYRRTEVQNAEMPEGQTRITQAGVPGREEITYEITYRGDEVISRTEVSRQVVEEAVDEVIEVGTRSPYSDKTFVANGATISITAVSRSSVNFNGRIAGDYLFITYLVDNTEGVDMVNPQRDHPGIILPGKEDERAYEGRRVGQVITADGFGAPSLKIGERSEIRVEYRLSDDNSIKPNEEITHSSDVRLFSTRPQSYVKDTWQEVFLNTPLSEFWEGEL